MHNAAAPHVIRRQVVGELFGRHSVRAIRRCRAGNEPAVGMVGDIVLAVAVEQEYPCLRRYLRVSFAEFTIDSIPSRNPALENSD